MALAFILHRIEVMSINHFDFNDLMAFGMFILAALLTFIYLICRWLNIEKPPQNLTGLRVDFLNL
ncbi:hypothetical protein ADH76_14495 [Enterocloster clostridioformis]|nr:hypothetical protein A4V08_35990 [Lachnoclostridium sp. YL32]NDO29914.1 hypothetical protein [Enterocloster clostridioformis]OXE67289.1 hypothetical protein ADH76_14495 [Enterocloster clostridioformis]